MSDKKLPLVSVICTIYNKEAWIGDAVESFLEQEADFEYEILLIDDKSTDGSRKIIADYEKEHPEKIRAFYNSKNLGITRTWKKICKEAKGKYIARCDGDDYWIDNKKLQKQVDLLEKRKGSLWCCTDYDIVTPEKKLTHKSAVETGFINRPETYAEMLATKGFTMASTWLVDTKLMKRVNNELDDMAVDDTFNIQLDLFNMTKLTYLPDSTTAYRVIVNSDSKPSDEASIEKRNERLLNTQLEYVDKYKNVQYAEMIRLLLRQDLESENRLRLVERQRKLIENQEKVVSEQNEAIKQKDKTISQKDKQILDILNSRRYKVGKIITSPVSVIKSVIKRRG